MIAIVDSKIGNVASLYNSISALGFESKITVSKKDIDKASHIILPGVGSFLDGMKSLKGSGLVKSLTDNVFGQKKPFLGICLGMQLLAETGEENGKHKGLGWVPGVTRKFKVDKKYRLPQIGWNDIKPNSGARLFKKIKSPIFYFVNSYHLVPKDKSSIIATGFYAEEFAASVKVGNIFGVQFHPEKSQKDGLQVLLNFITYDF